MAKGIFMGAFFGNEVLFGKITHMSAFKTIFICLDFIIYIQTHNGGK